MSDLNNWIDNIKNSKIQQVDKLDLNTIWTTENNLIWQAKEHYNASPFYPVYQYKDYYSISPLPLIFLKKEFNQDQTFWKTHNKKKSYYKGLNTVDKDIKRVNGSFSSALDKISLQNLIESVSNAMINDASRIESLYPDHENLVFCGGKDSLNILLLPWKKPIIVASAPPNFILVKEFIEKNNINVKEVIELKNEESIHSKIEILSNACLNDLSHCRWINDFISIAQKYPKCIFWKGQLGDTFLTNKRNGYRAKKTPIANFFKSPTTKYNDFIASLWWRGAMWQGAHIGQLRLATNKLVLSIYHGEDMTYLLKNKDFSCVDKDIRDLIGNYIFKKKVIYPTENPGPPKLRGRSDISTPSHFKKVLSSINF